MKEQAHQVLREWEMFEWRHHGTGILQAYMPGGDAPRVGPASRLHRPRLGTGPMARRRVVIVGHFRPHVRVIETVLQKPLDTDQDLPHLPNMAVKGRTGRIIQLAKAAMEEGMDLDTAWKHAAGKVSCSPGSLSLAYSLFLTIVTKPSTT